VCVCVCVCVCGLHGVRGGKKKVYLGKFDDFVVVQGTGDKY
jgi:hypothetical protein